MRKEARTVSEDEKCEPLHFFLQKSLRLRSLVRVLCDTQEACTRPMGVFFPCRLLRGNSDVHLLLNTPQT